MVKMETCVTRFIVSMTFLFIVSRPVSCPDVLVSARVRRTRADTGGECHKQEYQLIRDLMKQYDRDVRPSYNQSTPVTVSMDMTIHQILELDEKHETLTTSVWQRLTWHDAGLMWNPWEFGGVKRIRLGIERVWTPDITLVNNVQDNVRSSEMQAVVRYDGSVSWNTPRLMKSSCPLNIIYFPWDKQICNLQFASWTHDGGELALFSTADSADFDTDYVENGEWELLEVPVVREQFFAPCCEDPFSYLNFHVTLLRRSAYYVQNMIFPSVLITAAGMLVFGLPPESGEKMSLSVTILLATTVYQLIVADHIPVQSKVFPIIGLYLMMTQLLLAGSMTLTVIVLNTHHQGDTGKELPPFLRMLLHKCLGPMLFLGDSIKALKRDERRRSSSVYDTDFDRDCMNMDTPGERYHMTTTYLGMSKHGVTNYNHHLNGNTGLENPMDRDSHLLLPHIKTLTHSINNIEEWVKGKRRSDIRRAEWLLLSKALDRLFLVVYATSFVVSTVAILTGHTMFRMD